MKMRTSNGEPAAHKPGARGRAKKLEMRPANGAASGDSTQVSNTGVSDHVDAVTEPPQYAWEIEADDGPAAASTAIAGGDAGLPKEVRVDGSVVPEETPPTGDGIPTASSAAGTRTAVVEIETEAPVTEDVAVTTSGVEVSSVTSSTDPAEEVRPTADAVTDRATHESVSIARVTTDISDATVPMREESIHANMDVNATPQAEPTPEAARATSMATWGDRLELVRVDALVDHPLWSKIHAGEPPEREEALTDTLRAGGLGPHIVIVTGEGCSSPPNTILDGHRHRHALETIAPTKERCVLVARRIDLDADAEEIVIVTAALHGHHARRLSERRLAELEARLRTLYERRRGTRSDLQTSVGSNGTPTSGDTRDTVARAAGQSPNSVADRQKIFGSPISPLFVQQAVEQGTMARSAGAALVREVERDPDVQAVLREANDERWTDEQVEQHPVIYVARERVEERARAQLGRARQRTPNPEPAEPTVIPATFDAEGVRRGEGAHRRRLTLVAVINGDFHLTDRGPAGRGSRGEGH
jgi:hypothetical protein